MITTLRVFCNLRKMQVNVIKQEHKELGEEGSKGWSFGKCLNYKEIDCIPLNCKFCFPFDPKSKDPFKK